jgi:rSAM/selenodomain-associated transferase 1
MLPGSPALVVFARAAIAGSVKTRLIANHPVAGRHFSQSLSAADAQRLHCAFVADLLEKGQRVGFLRRRLYVAGPLSEPTLAKLAEAHGYDLCPQPSGDLGAKMAAAIAAELSAGASSVILIGSDSPTLPIGYLRRAASWLATDVDLVLGPATDGGYYLVGARHAVPELFAPGIDWGSTSVLTDTMARLQQLQQRGLRPALLPFFYDCDTADDLRLLHAHLQLGAGPLTPPATADSSELLDCAAPRTAALLDELSRR